MRNTASRQHFEVQCAPEGRGLLLTNLSAAGTWLNGAPLLGAAALRPGDVVALGVVNSEYGSRPALQFRVIEEPAAEAPSFDHFRAGAEAPGSVLAMGPVKEPGENPAVALQARPDHPSASRSPDVDRPQDADRSSASAADAAAVAADDAHSCLVRISAAALPPPFALTCEWTSGVAGAELDSIPLKERALEASCFDAQLKVGRAVQPPAFWSALLPDETVRNQISREHFEVRLDDDGELVLWNFSASGTLVNGKRVLDHATVLPGDLIGLTPSLHCDDPLLSFRLSAAG